jgi:hypothetical protein
VDYITGYQYALAKSQDTTQLDEFDGQIELSVRIEPNPGRAISEFSTEDLAGITDGICSDDHHRIRRGDGRCIWEACWNVALGKTDNVGKENSSLHRVWRTHIFNAYVITRSLPLTTPSLFI